MKMSISHRAWTLAPLASQSKLICSCETICRGNWERRQVIEQLLIVWPTWSLQMSKRCQGSTPKCLSKEPHTTTSCPIDKVLKAKYWRMTKTFQTLTSPSAVTAYLKRKSNLARITQSLLSCRKTGVMLTSKNKSLMNGTRLEKQSRCKKTNQHAKRKTSRRNSSKTTTRSLSSRSSKNAKEARLRMTRTASRPTQL